MATIDELKLISYQPALDVVLSVTLGESSLCSLVAEKLLQYDLNLRTQQSAAQHQILRDRYERSEKSDYECNIR